MQSTGFYTHALRAGMVYPDRSSALLPLATERRVLHVGCTDAPLTDSRIEEGTLLHEELMRVAHQLHGVDVDEGGIGIIREAFGGTYSVCDISKDLPPVSFVPDLILAADVIEHVPNQGSFVAGLGRLANLYPDAVVAISTPNALAMRSFLNTASGREIIHPDHCLLHSPATLQRLLTSQGLHLERLLYYNVRSGRGAVRMAYDAIPRLASHLRAGFADGMVALARSS